MSDPMANPFETEQAQGSTFVLPIRTRTRNVPPAAQLATTADHDEAMIDPPTTVPPEEAQEQEKPFLSSLVHFLPTKIFIVDLGEIYDFINFFYPAPESNTWDRNAEDSDIAWDPVSQGYVALGLLSGIVRIRAASFDDEEGFNLTDILWIISKGTDIEFDFDCPILSSILCANMEEWKENYEYIYGCMLWRHGEGWFFDLQLHPTKTEFIEPVALNFLSSLFAEHTLEFENGLFEDWTFKSTNDEVLVRVQA